MAHAIGLRATSFAASAALLGLAALGALTMRFVHQQTIAPDGYAPIATITEPPPPPPQTDQSTPVRQIANFFQSILTDSAPPLESAPPTPTEIAIAGPSDPPVITNPSWVRRPRDLAAYYPRRALERGVEGGVTLDCLVATSGRLACSVVSESPANWGFAEAALRISRDYQMVPASRDGAPTEARHRMVIPFRLE